MKFGVFGAGAVGTYVGVKISSAGHPVILVGRSWLADRRAHLVAKSIKGHVSKPQQIEVGADAGALRDVDVVLVAVKSQDTPAAIEALRPVVKRDTLVVSLQNGIRNAEMLRQLDAEIVPGTVTYNVIWEGAQLNQATSGPLLVGPSGHPGIGEMVAALRASKEKASVRRDIEAIQMGKLLINLNNGILAAAGMPTIEFVRNRSLRTAGAICIREGLEVATKAGKAVASIGLLSPWLISKVLMVPDAILFRVAGGMISIDPKARSSTLQDLDRRKKTEIEFLNGEIVRLAREHSLEAPANAFITDTVHRLERSQGDLQFLTPEDVLRGVASDHGRSPETAKG